MLSLVSNFSLDHQEQKGQFWLSFQDIEQNMSTVNALSKFENSTPV